MNRIIASVLILFIVSMHSAWAVGVHLDSSHAMDTPSHLGDEHPHVSDGDDVSNEACNEHDCHISAHVAGVFSNFPVIVNHDHQTIAVTVQLSNYLHSQQTPQRPPKI